MLGTGGATPTQPPIMHLGSIYGETDYTVRSNIISASLYYRIHQKIHIDLEGNYSSNKADFDQFFMTNNSHKAEAEDIIEASFYDYSMIHEYSDLFYSFLNLKFGTEYKLSKRFSLIVGLDIYDLDDNRGYVYGVESGTFYVIRSGFRLSNFGF